MNLTVLGINFRTAPIELREKFSFRPEDVPAALRHAGQCLHGAELVLISTCNRTELYIAGIDGLQKDQLITPLMSTVPASEIDDLAAHFYLKKDIDVVEHLIAVASSLDSMVVGETEILGQVRQAYMIAREEQLGGKTLHAVFQTAFRYAKRVHTETEICRGRVSVSSIAVEFAEKVFDELSEKTIMIVGAGETAELALKSLIERGVTEILVLNRSFDKGKALAGQYGGEAIRFELLAEHLPRTDIVISSTAAPHCVIQTDNVQRAVKDRRGQPILLIDIAVPRDIEAGVGRLENVYLYHIDDLQRVAEENLAKRQEAVDEAWEIVREGVAHVVSALEVTGLKLLMKQLDRKARDIEETELKRAFARDRMAELPETCRNEIEMLVHRTVNKILASPRETLRKAEKNGQWAEYSKATKGLFGLEEEHYDRDI